MKLTNVKETKKALESATVPQLRKAAKADGVKLPSKAGKPQIVEAMVIHYHPDPEGGAANVLNKTKAAKKAPSHRAKMALVYDALKAANDDKVKTPGFTATFWKARPDAADFGGLTLRLTKSEAKGIDKAIRDNLTKALKGAGVAINFDSNAVSFMTIRKGGFFTLGA